MHCFYPFHILATGTGKVICTNYQFNHANGVPTIMTNYNEKQAKTFFETLQGEFDYYPLDYITIEDLNNCNDFYALTEKLEGKMFFDEDIIYYGNAMQFLSDYDPSLRDSIKFAEDYGYQAGDMNSELLATILATEMKQIEWYENKDAINNFLKGNNGESE